jgi:rhamnosyltransferase subunit B
VGLINDRVFIPERIARSRPVDMRVVHAGWRFHGTKSHLLSRITVDDSGIVARIVLSTFGSLGDLHPFLAIAGELRKRGHQAIIASSAVYRNKVEAENIEFAPVRPDIAELLDEPEMLRKLWDPARGTEYLLRDYLAPRIEQSYEDLSRACLGADLLVTHVVVYAAPIVAEVSRLPWISVVLQPSIFLSASDAPVLPAAWLRHLYPLGKQVTRGLFALGKARVRGWVRPVIDLRRRLGLSIRENPVFEGVFSKLGALALFSRHFAAPQADWPAGVSITGFVLYDQLGKDFGEFVSGKEQERPEELARFLAAGPAPVLFTLGSSAVMQPGTFFEQSIAAARRLGVRAVLLVGNQPLDKFQSQPSDWIFVARYAPFSKLMPHAAVIVHQGGIGTTAQALYAGRPMLVVPWAHDQPDNAERLRKLGVSRTLSRREYIAEAAARELRWLIEEPQYAEAAKDLRERLSREDGLAAASDKIEAALAKIAW